MMPVFTAYGPMSNILKKKEKSMMGGFTQPVSWGQVEARTDLFFFLNLELRISSLNNQEQSH